MGTNTRFTEEKNKRSLIKSHIEYLVQDLDRVSISYNDAYERLE